jgi:hypothetical protein
MISQAKYSNFKHISEAFWKLVKYKLSENVNKN